MTDAERANLASYRDARLLGVIALVSLIVFLGLEAYLLYDAGEDFFRSFAPFVSLVAIFWIWLLRKAPLQWRRAIADLKSGDTDELVAPARIRQARGFGVIPTPRSILLVGERRFDIRSDEADALIEGQSLRVRFGAASGALLSHAPAGEPQPSAEPVHLDEKLTRREEDILRLMAKGLTDKEIARELNLSPTTVRTYNTALYAKLGVSRRAQAIPFAARLGLAD